jgi:hypothetical protein
MAKEYKSNSQCLCSSLESDSMSEQDQSVSPGVSVTETLLSTSNLSDLPA